MTDRNSVLGEAATEALFASLAHGDEQHRTWLKAAINAHFAGEPIPPPVLGKTREEAKEAAYNLGYAAGRRRPPSPHRRTPAEPVLPDRNSVLEEAAKVAERIWDTGQQGAHGGEQANRTAAAIRALRTPAEPVLPEAEGVGTSPTSQALREALEHAIKRLESAAKCFRANGLEGLAGNVDLDIRDTREIAALTFPRGEGEK